MFNFKENEFPNLVLDVRAKYEVVAKTTVGRLNDAIDDGQEFLEYHFKDLYFAVTPGGFAIAPALIKKLSTDRERLEHESADETVFLLLPGGYKSLFLRPDLYEEMENQRQGIEVQYENMHKKFS